MKKIVIANLKMNMDYDTTNLYVQKINKNIIVCPSYIFIPFFLNEVKTGAQDCSVFEKGSYTGQVSALHLKQMGVDYVIIGHSEKRKYDDDNTINLKIKTALKSGLKVILCIGENKDDNKSEKILNQLEINLKDIDINNVIIAYEPIWAIGTDVIPTNEEIEETINFIKENIRTNFNKEVKVLYGGSVDLTNVEKLNQIDVVDGFLVGRASTDYNQINSIYETLNN